MDFVFLLPGIALLLLVLVDLLWTTLWVDGGAGPLSARLTEGTWQALGALGREGSRPLSLAGPLLLVATLTMWLGLIWGGWTLVFAAGDPSLFPAREGVPVDWTGRFYFVGYSMFTLGHGDYFPAAGFWQIATAMTTANGMLFVTMGVSYVVSVLEAVPAKRAFAGDVHGLGKTGEAIVVDGWDGESFQGLDLPVNDLGREVSDLSQHHRSFPILHFYHTEHRQHASARALAAFDEALTLLRYGVAPDARPDHVLLEKARRANEDYLETLTAAYVEPAVDAPEPPDLEALRQAGIPTVCDDRFDRAVSRLQDRRRKLRAIVEADARDWPGA